MEPNWQQILAQLLGGAGNQYGQMPLHGRMWGALAPGQTAAGPQDNSFLPEYRNTPPGIGSIPQPGPVGPGGPPNQTSLQMRDPFAPTSAPYAGQDPTKQAKGYAAQMGGALGQQGQQQGGWWDDNFNKYLALQIGGGLLGGAADWYSEHTARKDRDRLMREEQERRNRRGNAFSSALQRTGR